MTGITDEMIAKAALALHDLPNLRGHSVAEVTRFAAEALQAGLAGCAVVDLPEALEHNERGATWISNKGAETEGSFTAFLHWSDNSPTVETDFAEWGTAELRAQSLAGLAACDFADRLAAELSSGVGGDTR